MGVEIEVKLKVESLEAVRGTLRRVGGVRRDGVLETNTLYDRPDGSMRAADSALRLRRLTRPDGSAGPTTMTYKGPRVPGEVKIRPELEVEVSDWATADGILRALGLQRSLTFEKRRESWRMGPCRVELDELPYHGTFVEIEGPDVDSVTEVRERIGLGAIEPIRASYPQMIHEYCRRSGLADRRVAFPP